MGIVSFTVLATISSSGCATVLEGKHPSVTVTSMTPGSAIFVDGMQVALTPARISKSAKARSRDHGAWRGERAHVPASVERIDRLGDPRHSRVAGVARRSGRSPAAGARLISPSA
jgi:hypothetical protein